MAASVAMYIVCIGYRFVIRTYTWVPFRVGMSSTYRLMRRYIYLGIHALACLPACVANDTKSKMKMTNEKARKRRKREREKCCWKEI